jgi:soluble lytic murein transglycosylase
MHRSLIAVLLSLIALTALAQPAEDKVVLDAREALRVNDRNRLATLRDQAVRSQHALASWLDYWELGARLKDAQQAELDAFYARWPGTYVEDRLRNDWLLVLGQRRDWDNFKREQPRFRMADDREVDCYALLLRQLDGQEDVRDAAAAAWLAQKRDDDGCTLMARSLAGAGRMDAAQIWPKVRQQLEAGKPKAAQAAAALLGAATESLVRDALANPLRWLVQHGRSSGLGNRGEAAVLALMRLAASDPDSAAAQAQDWGDRLRPAQAAYAWAGMGRQAALKLLPSAAGFYAEAWRHVPAGQVVDWPADTLAWGARAALRADPGTRWPLLLRSVEGMSGVDQTEPAWVYWKARALQASAAAKGGDAARAQGQQMMQGLAGPQSFYGLLALEDLGGRFAPAAAPAPLTEAERSAARNIPGLQRALRLIELGLRSEGVREWNFTLRDVQGDRALLAVAELACAREVWDRCINTSDRTRDAVDLAQRYPTPFRSGVADKARSAGLDAATVYGLIRQESRFIIDARSGVGASGLMQLMPATARWTARKVGLDYEPAMITDHDVNLRLGTAYLSLLVDDFEGAQPLAIAGYNAGPGRPRRWREGPVLETAAWIENIPFNETRDYVKKVLANAVHYAAVLGEPGTSLKARLGASVGPRKPQAAVPNKDLP